MSFSRRSLSPETARFREKQGYKSRQSKPANSAWGRHACFRELE